MSLLRAPLPANLTCSISYHEERFFSEALIALTERYGPLDATSEVYDFSAISAHYDAEMGSPVMKRIVSFERLLPREEFAPVKVFAVELEKRFSREGKRQVNLDPGLLTMENFVLATGKNYSHRLYLGEGVFAEVTLLFTKDGTIQALPWTYRDYLRDPAASFLLSLRPRYKEKIEPLKRK